MSWEPIGKDLTVEDLKKLAKKFRIELIQMLYEAGSGHPGGSLSEMEILITLYYKFARIDPKNPDWPERDRIVLSKGHAAPGLYIVLANLGFFPKEWYKTLNFPGHKLTTHAEREIPGIEASTGALAQGFAMAVGMAIAGKYYVKPNFRVWVILGDGELQEGQVWESARVAAKYKLDNLVAIVDRNRYQVDGSTEEIAPLEPLYEIWWDLGWVAFNADGHNFEDLIDKFSKAVAVRGKPAVIIARTVKGRECRLWKTPTCGTASTSRRSTTRRP